MVDEQKVVRVTAPGFAYGTGRNVSIGAWGIAPSVARLEQVRSGQDALLISHPSGFVVLNLIRVSGSIQTLDASARAESEAMIKQFAGSIRATATVFQGGGFLWSIIRSVLAAQRMVARAKYPEKFFEGDGEVAAWVLPLALGRAPTPDETRGLVAAIEAMWRALPPTA